VAQELSYLEFRAIEHYFLATSRDFCRLSPVERRKLIEAEHERRESGLDREPKGDFSYTPRHLSGRGTYDIT
jgi:hypothetical protein